MKLKTLTLGATLLSLSCFSQNLENTLSLYSNFKFEKTEVILTTDSTFELRLSDGFNLGGLSFAFGKQLNDKWNTEILIQDLELLSISDEVVTIINPSGNPQTTHGVRLENSSVGIGLEAHRKFGKNDSNKLHFRLGGLAYLRFQYTNVSPLISTFFQTEIFRTIAQLDLVPRLSYDVNQRCNLNFSALIPIVNTNLTGERTQNPRSPQLLQSNSNYNLEIFKLPTHFRLGLTYKLASKG